ncbi:MAG TPA: hypothetical protein VL099_00165 [Candidatus Binatia bacterium]|nr:hypothetical protein [Candidatus Binatia bacterium]
MADSEAGVSTVEAAASMVADSAEDLARHAATVAAAMATGELRRQGMPAEEAPTVPVDTPTRRAVIPRRHIVEMARTARATASQAA